MERIPNPELARQVQHDSPVFQKHRKPANKADFGDLKTIGLPVVRNDYSEFGQFLGQYKGQLAIGLTRDPAPQGGGQPDLLGLELLTREELREHWQLDLRDEGCGFTRGNWVKATPDAKHADEDWNFARWYRLQHGEFPEIVWQRSDAYIRGWIDGMRRMWDLEVDH